MSDNKNTEEFDNDGTEEEEEEEIDPETVPTAYLKAIANDGFNSSWEVIAKDMDIPKGQAEKIINECVETMMSTHKELNYPVRLLERYNKFAQSGEDVLTTEDVVVLMKLVNRVYNKLTQEDLKTINTKMKKLGRKTLDQREHAKSVPQIPVQQVTYTDSYAQPPPQPIHGQAPPQTTQAPPPAQQFDPYSQYESDESMMKYLLEMNYNVRDPDRIRFFLQQFRMSKNDWLANPVKLLVALKSTFGNVAGESVMQMFMDAKSRIPNNATALYQITGASGYKPMIDPRSYLGQVNPAMTDFMNQMGANPFGSTPNQPDGGIDPSEKEFNRLTKIMGLSMMQTMAKQSMGGMNGQPQGAQGGGGFDPNMYDYNDIYDPNTGRFVKREWIRKGFGYGPATPSTNPSDKSTELMMKFMEAMMTTANSDRQVLMNKLLSGDNQGAMHGIIETLLKQAVGGMATQVDPVQNLNKFLELGEKVAQLKQQPQKTIDEKKIEMDYLLARMDMQNRENEKQRQFNREAQESNDANVRYQDTIKEVGNVIKEAAGPAIEIIKTTMGRGLGPMPGMPPTGMPPGYQPQAQAQPTKVIVQQVPAPQQQQPQYTPDQIRLLQQEEMRRRQQQQEMENRPIEEELAQLSQEELEDLAHRSEEDAMRLEHIGNKIMTERARRMGHVYTPQRSHVAPIVQAIKEHEQQHQHVPDDYNYPAEEPSINPFESGATEENMAPSVSATAVDVSKSYNDPEVQEQMREQGLLPQDEQGTKDNLNMEENQSVAIPASTSMQIEDGVVEVDESEMVDDGESVVE